MAAYRALAPVLGPVQAKQLLRALDPAWPEQTVAALDEAHALLHRERSELRAAREAARLMTAEPVDGNDVADSMGVSELAGRSGYDRRPCVTGRPKALIVPDRWSSRRIRRYTPAHLRDARIVYQLRTAGHRIDALRTLMPDLRAGHQQQSLDEALDARQASITKRSLALLDAARCLHAILAVH